MISKHLDKKNLHHAYLIEGERSETLPEVLKFIKSLGLETLGNADVRQISLDVFKIEDARNLKSYVSERGMSQEKNAKRIFIISANNFLLEAQNSLLKIFEEPIENTHFFVITPETGNLLKTFISRFYLISSKGESKKEVTDAENFIKMTLKNRLEFIKELLIEQEEEEGIEIVIGDSTRAKSLKFLNALETSLHSKFIKNSSDITCFSHFFKVRQFLRMPGSSAKTLMESVAIVTPNF